jgi:hypothetical protein
MRGGSSFSLQFHAGFDSAKINHINQDLFQWRVLSRERHSQLKFAAFDFAFRTTRSRRASIGGAAARKQFGKAIGDFCKRHKRAANVAEMSARRAGASSRK